MKRTVIFFTAALCLLWGCAKKDTSSTGTLAQEYLNLWLNEYHPGVNASSTGVYILEEEVGSGSAWNSETPISLLMTTIRGLGGVISSTGHEEYAKQLGTYVAGNYYGPLVTYTQNGYAGVEAVLSGMRVGGTRTAVVPSWLLTTDRHSSQKEYLDACTNSTHLIYTITLAGQASDVTKWEQNSVEDYILRNLGNTVQLSSFNDDTKENNLFWFGSNAASVQEGQKAIESNTKYKLNYTGRLLNGQVFDTTIERVAKDNGIYNSSRTYAPVTITTADSYENYALDGNTSLVDGFKGALSLMQYVGEKATTLFTSALGYSANGSSSTIPPYAPLRFDLEIVSLVD
jgi:FKBP-type peptidyl-prolyl cis-trans isomerase FklB